MLKGLETLPLRVQAQCATAAKIADLLAGQKGVTRVLYPRSRRPSAGGAGRGRCRAAARWSRSRLKAARQGAFRFLNALRLIKISNNLGDAKSLITHPATTTHFRLTQPQRDELGISDGMIRLSIGLEAAEDIADDLTSALRAAHG